jgi:N-methylhydantoinase B
MGVDPILRSVVTNRLTSISHKMGESMLRSSRSPIFAEARDFVTAVFDRRLRLVAQTPYIPVLIGSTPVALKAIAGHFNGTVTEGDVFVLNDPYWGNNHLPDVTVVRPVFHGGVLRFWAFTRGHQTDIGGGAGGGYNPGARTCWEEGLMIPPSRLFAGGKRADDLWTLILNNVRYPLLVEGDLQCMVGATRIGEQELVALLHKYGPETVEEIIEELLCASERRVRAEIAAMPDGVYRAQRQLDYQDPEAAALTIRLSLTIAGDEMTFDFAGTDPQVPHFLNSPLANTMSACYQAVFTTLDPDIPFNEGALSPIRVSAPEGSVVHPKKPAPTTYCTVLTAAAIVEAAWLALSQAVPERTQAAWARSCSGIGSGPNPRTGRPFACIHHFCKGGAGGTYGFDGWDHIGGVIVMGGSRAPDPELYELVTPHTILEFQYWPDSGGAGTWRGGHGISYRVRFEADDTTLAILIGGITEETAPYGLEGGHPAPKSIVKFHRGDSAVEEVTSTTLYRPRKGDVFQVMYSGGGGYGDPFERPAERVREDVMNGLLSLDKAKSEYGVVLDPSTLALDDRETQGIRARGHEGTLSSP